MKRLVTLLVLSLGLFGIASGQTSFNITTNSVWTIASSLEDDVEGLITISNPTASTQTIKWERTVLNITSGCQTQVCDLNLCYIPSVSTKTFDIAAGASGDILMHFLNTDMNPNATALAQLKLSNLNNPADSVIVTFLFTPETSGTKDLPAATVKMFPNPATDYFRLDQAEAVSRMRLFALDGREVARFTAVPGETYSLAAVPVGSYVLALEDKNGRVFQALELAKQ